MDVIVTRALETAVGHLSRGQLDSTRYIADSRQLLREIDKEPKYREGSASPAKTTVAYFPSPRHKGSRGYLHMLSISQFNSRRVSTSAMCVCLCGRIIRELRFNERKGTSLF